MIFYEKCFNGALVNGLVMIGWTISFTFLTMEKFWQAPGSRKYNGD
jgi:hypothetical protein